MIMGYIRVSTTAQNVERQIDILNKYGAERLFVDKMTGTNADRPQLNKMFEQLRKGDIVVVTELSRLGRSLKDLLIINERIENIGAELISLKDKIDTTTPYGKFFFAVNAAFVQLQRDVIAETTKDGLRSARARGRFGGRPKIDNRKIEKALKLYRSEQYSLKEISDMTGISKSTIYNYVKKERDKNETP